MKKTYVLDTNVLVQAPHALWSFENNDIVLPAAVLEELDGLKNADGEKGVNARQAIRFLEKLRQFGDLAQGVNLPEGGRLRLELNCVDVPLPEGMKADSPDNRILKVCKGLEMQGKPNILVTKDIVVRIKAQMLGVHAEDFTTEQVPQAEDQYTGRCRAFVADHKLEIFKERGLKIEELYTVGKEGQRMPVEPVENQFFILNSDLYEKKTMLGRYHKGRVCPLAYAGKQPYGVRPRNAGQYFLQEALMMSAKEAPLVIVKGMAGTAKTFYAMAVGLSKIMESQRPEFRKILVCRSNAQFDDEIGFLPGSEQEKISPLLRPVIDNLEILLSRDESADSCFPNEKELKGKIDYLFDAGIITAEAMNYIRGRSISHTWLIIDEAQNLSPAQAKGIITRAGAGTKLILLGDPAQIDRPFLDERTNGLSFAAEKMKGSPLCVQITMHANECERSDLAWEAARRM